MSKSIPHLRPATAEEIEKFGKPVLALVNQYPQELLRLEQRIRKKRGLKPHEPLPEDTRQLLKKAQEIVERLRDRAEHFNRVPDKVLSVKKRTRFGKQSLLLLPFDFSLPYMNKEDKTEFEALGGHIIQNGAYGNLDVVIDIANNMGLVIDDLFDVPKKASPAVVRERIERRLPEGVDLDDAIWTKHHHCWKVYSYKENDHIDNLSGPEITAMYNNVQEAVLSVRLSAKLDREFKVAYASRVYGEGTTWEDVIKMKEAEVTAKTSRKKRRREMSDESEGDDDESEGDDNGIGEEDLGGSPAWIESEGDDDDNFGPVQSDSEAGSDFSE